MSIKKFNKQQQMIKTFIGVIAMLAVLCIPIASYMSKDTVTFTVNKTERIVKEDTSYYLVFTDQGVYKNVDAFLHFKFDSSDLYNMLTPNRSYTCVKNFWRVRFLSMYENLLSCEEVQK